MYRIYLLLTILFVFLSSCDLYTWKEPPTDCDSGPCCLDGNWLAEGETCLSGADAIDCTTDVCNVDHECTHPVSNGSCLIDGACYSHNQDHPEQSCRFCDTNVSQSTWQNKVSSTICDDSDLCTYNDRCGAGGICEGTSLTCESDPESCGLKRSCDGSDTCLESYPTADTTCDDEEPCTHSDSCDGAGTCTGILITCEGNSDPCAHQSYCNGSKECVIGFPGDTTSCDDDDLCTHSDACDGSGGCIGTSIQCEDDASTCGMTRMCDGSSSCVEEYPTADTTCNDDDPCTGNDACDGQGLCSGILYDCNDHGTCNSDDDVCTCNDSAFSGDYCDQCAVGYFEQPASSGTCIADPCSPDPCNGHGSCDNSTGVAICTCNDAYIGDVCDEGCSDIALGSYPDCFVPSVADCLAAPCFSVPPTNVSNCYNETAIIDCSNIGGQSPDCGSLSSDCGNPASLADTCFCGQDGQYTGNARSLTCYNASGTESPCTSLPIAATDEVVTDSLTDLMWQRTFASDKNFQQANEYCISLNDIPGYGDYTDWRVPTAHELFSLTDDSRHNPVADDDAFPGVTGSYWSDTVVFDDVSLAWSNHFSYGLVSSGSTGTAKNVRCVRGGYEAGETSIGSWFSQRDYGGDIVLTDNVSALSWASQSGSSLTWQEALTYCQDLNYAEKDDWRLPDKKELMSLVDFASGDPATGLPGITNGGYWSSTAHVNTLANAWYVDFTNGNLLSNTKTQTMYARCVRESESRSGE